MAKRNHGNAQKIKLTTTTDFYSNTIPVATGAIVAVTNTTLSTPSLINLSKIDKLENIFAAISTQLLTMITPLPLSTKEKLILQL